MIKQFKDEYSWLSNFQRFEKPLIYEGIEYPTNEHFYQAMKTTDKELRATIAKHPAKGLKAFCRKIELRDNWDSSIKDTVMEYGLRYKFSDSNPTLKAKLLATEDRPIVEGNWWNDIYWGVDLKTGKGQNKLGLLLMIVRTDIKKNIQ